MRRRWAHDASCRCRGARGRVLLTDPLVRAVARRLYAATEQLPLVSPYGHMPAQWLTQATPFTDPTSLLLSPDHYVSGCCMPTGFRWTLGVGGSTLDEAGSRRACRSFCERWYLLRGTPSRFWMESVLSDVLLTNLRPSAATAEKLYDHIAGCVASEAFGRDGCCSSSGSTCSLPPTTRETTWRATRRLRRTTASSAACCRRSDRTSTPRTPTPLPLANAEPGRDIRRVEVTTARVLGPLRSTVVV